MTLRLKLAHKKHEIQVAIPPHEAVKETFGDLKVRLIFGNHVALRIIEAPRIVHSPCTPAARGKDVHASLARCAPSKTAL